ncbi:hypothetical protein EDD86DRAFT_204487 [Gorgonomyces haynaldii]|nr:hypothetical protein EDD86DRAFT_204487 [Gorgonomyces haynaldii]
MFVLLATSVAATYGTYYFRVNAFDSRCVPVQSTYESGVSACGNQYGGGSAYWAAVTGGNQHCGQTATVTYQGRSIQVTILDECPGCGDGHIDMSLDALVDLTGSYEAACAINRGLPQLEWYYNGGSSQPSQPQQPQQPSQPQQPEQPSQPKPEESPSQPSDYPTVPQTTPRETQPVQPKPSEPQPEWTPSQPQQEPSEPKPEWKPSEEPKPEWTPTEQPSAQPSDYPEETPIGSNPKEFGNTPILPPSSASPVSFAFAFLFVLASL